MISSLLNTSYYLYRSPTHFLLTSSVSFYLLTDCAPTPSIDSPVHLNFLFSFLSNLPDCVTPWILCHLNLPAIVIAPLNTDTGEYSDVLARHQACQPVNLLDGHAASQSLWFCVKTLIKKSHTWSYTAARPSFYSLYSFSSHRSSCVLRLFLSFASVSSSFISSRTERPLW